MNKLILTIASVLVLTACDVEPYNKELTQTYPLPDGLEDCKIYYLQNKSGNSLKVVRCPNSSTTTQWQAGKIQASATVTEM